MGQLGVKTCRMDAGLSINTLFRWRDMNCRVGLPSKLSRVVPEKVDMAPALGSATDEAISSKLILSPVILTMSFILRFESCTRVFGGEKSKSLQKS
jgi:hypothetical protein